MMKIERKVEIHATVKQGRSLKFDICTYIVNANLSAFPTRIPIKNLQEFLKKWKEFFYDKEWFLFRLLLAALQVFLKQKA